MQVDDEEGENHSWDGTVNMLRRYTTKIVEKSTKELKSRIEKLQEDINESSTQEKNADRQLKSQMKKIMGSIKQMRTN